MGMTATERLRALLDERGVEWRAWDGVHPITVWHDEQCVYEYMERTLLDGVKPHTGEVVDGTGRLEAVIHVCSPEQAIAATLGDTDATGARQGDAVEVVRCRDCAHAVVSRPFYTFAGRPADIEVWRCDYFWNVNEPPEVEPDGFCAWGKRKESE